MMEALKRDKVDRGEIKYLFHVFDLTYLHFKNGAIYLVYPDIPILQLPTIENAFLFTMMTLGKVAR
jgi:hypothetical protein